MKKLLLAVVATFAVSPAFAWNYTDGSTQWMYADNSLIQSQDQITELKLYFNMCGNSAWGLAKGDRTYADQLLSYCMHRKGYKESAPQAPPAPLPHFPPSVTSTKGLNANQIKAGCKKVDGTLFCGSPGTGMCFKKGHNPWYGQPAEAISVGNQDIDPHGPDEGHDERCG